MSLPGTMPPVAGGLILMDAAGRTLLRAIPFQYNPDTLSRTLTPRASKIEGGDRLEATRLTGPPMEVIKFDAEFDGVDRVGGQPRSADVAGDLAALETIISPSVASIAAEAQQAMMGTLEILPAAGPLVLLVLGPRRVLPVRITDLAVVEEMFDPYLNPIRAKVGITLRVLTSDDLPPGSKGSALYLAVMGRREALAIRRRGQLSTMGLAGVP
jgi:hypothetical protein